MCAADWQGAQVVSQEEVRNQVGTLLRQIDDCPCDRRGMPASACLDCASARAEIERLKPLVSSQVLEEDIDRLAQGLDACFCDDYGTPECATCRTNRKEWERLMAIKKAL
jgi:hypothetical protein